jgi:hypothetical protein
MVFIALLDDLGGIPVPDMLMNVNAIMRHAHSFACSIIH